MDRDREEGTKEEVEGALEVGTEGRVVEERGKGAEKNRGGSEDAGAQQGLSEGWTVRCRR